jgi:hypothetical protein
MNEKSLQTKIENWDLSYGPSWMAEPNFILNFLSSCLEEEKVYFKKKFIKMILEDKNESFSKESIIDLLEETFNEKSPL